MNVLIAVDAHPEGLNRVRTIAAGGSVVCIDPFPPGKALPNAQISDRTILFGSFPPQNLAQMRRLEWFQLASAGYEQLSGFPVKEMGLRVTNASGVNDVPIAEWCVLMMLMFERGMSQLLEMQQQRGWERKPKYQSELRGRRVGIIGYGNIGREVARLCHGLGLEVWAMNRGPIGPRLNRFAVRGTGDPDGILPQRTFLLHEMADFIPHLDYLVLTLPRTPTTIGLLGEPELRLMRPSAVLLNPSRASLVKEEALVRVLQECRIAGAALDVHYQYPLPADHPLWSLPNVVLTPHISGSDGSRYYLSRLWELFAENLERYVRGAPLLNELAPGDLD